MKNIVISNVDCHTSQQSPEIFIEKITNLQEIIKRTIIAVQSYKKTDIYGANEMSICIRGLEELFTSLAGMLLPLHRKKMIDYNQYINQLQESITELSSIFRMFGTARLDDLISICFGQKFIAKNIIGTDIESKYQIMREYVHPISYKIMLWNKKHAIKGRSSQTKTLKKNRIVEDFMIVETAENLDCFDLARTTKAFHTKVYGLKLCIQDPIRERTVIISALVDDLMVECLNYKFIENRIRSITENKPLEPKFKEDAFNRFICSLTIKELLVYNNDELYSRYIGFMNQCDLTKQKTISQITKEFVNNDLYSQRLLLIQLLLRSNEHEFQYLAYLLYDLLSTDTNGIIDTQEQGLIFDSLPWNVKQYFREAMKQTVNYTNNLSNLDNMKVPLEQQICLLKADDNIKEKAMLKLKEVKAKSEDSGSKARQYLEGLLRIPFGIFVEEPILSSIHTCNSILSTLDLKLNNTPFSIKLPGSAPYTVSELRRIASKIGKTYSTRIIETLQKHISKQFVLGKRATIVDNVIFLNSVIKKHALNVSRVCHSGKRIEDIKTNLLAAINSPSMTCNALQDIATREGILHDEQNTIDNVNKDLLKIEQLTQEVQCYMNSVTKTLDDAVHGHNKAKRQIERIIGQWVNGEKTGYCFGFEGPPGVGKTSLAKKGIAHCLVDSEKKTRPFSFIAIGGSSNGSTLEGHNYTYVGSTWGRIVDILMEKRCMNPIIFIDELDKVSKTEHGREIIGVLTHLIDPTQNEGFQDKYFNGIDLDLSKALFIFSYNDPDAIDRILLDRIHRVKFEHLSLKDKLTIAEKHLLPEIYKKMGMGDTIHIPNDIIELIIEQYTCEPGVRKLKEVLFEIVGELNLRQLREENTIANINKLEINTAFQVSEDIVKEILKGRHPIRIKKVHSAPAVGLMTGLWANGIGRGGTLPIEVQFTPSSGFLDLRLTGCQGDVMKESMTVAKTIAWDKLPIHTASHLKTTMQISAKQGIHIHVPEGATPKDGPSAGAAITTAMFSLFTNKPIPNHIAMTGEICLQGNVTAIGGLDLKILGGIRAGVTHFLYPAENSDQFNEFHEKYKNSSLIENITFTSVKTIDDVFNIVFAANP